MELIFATHNSNKTKEIKELLPHLEVKSLAEIGWEDEIVEDGNSFTANADLKSEAIHNKLNTNVFSDDSGLVVPALDGAPGIHTAHYSGSRDAQKNMAKLLHELKPGMNREAYFVSVISLIWEGKKYHFNGKVHGQILMEQKGTGGFGYDPIFQPNGYNISFAEMDAEMKNKLSHRGKAVAKLVEFLNTTK